MFPISIGAIVSLVTGLGPTLSSIGKQIADYKIAKDNTASQREKNKIDQQIAEAHDRRDVVVAEAGNRVAVFMKGIMRFAIVAGPLSYLLKVTLWDKVIGSFVGCAANKGQIIAAHCTTFRTDPLTFNIDPVTGSVIAAACAFYLMYDIASVSRRS